MLTKKMLRDMKGNIAQFITIFLMALIGVAVFSGINSSWYGMERAQNKYYKSTNFADLWVTGHITDEVYNTVKAAAEVVDTERRLIFDAAIDGQSDITVRTNIVERGVISAPQVSEGKKFGTKGIWLSKEFAAKQGYKCGDAVSLNYSGINLSLIIEGLIFHPDYIYAVKDETELMPDFSKFGYAFATFDDFPLSPVYNQIIVKTKNPSAVTTDLKARLGYNYTISGRAENPSVAAVNNEIEQNKIVGTIFPVIFLLVAVLTMLTTMTRIVAKQRGQIGALRALGFGKGTIILHYLAYGFFVGTAGALLGFIIGPLTLGNIMLFAHSGFYTLPALKVAVSAVNIAVVLGCIICCMAASLAAVIKQLRGTPSQTMLPPSPKTRRQGGNNKLLRLFSFSTQWNLRDLMRHKTRCIVTIIGTLGAMALFVSALGLKNSLDGIDNKMYGELNTYQYKSYFSENIDDASAIKLKNIYNAQLLRTAEAEIITGNYKAYAAEFTVMGEGEYLKFQDRKGKFIDFSGGLGISYKLAGQLGVKKGDVINWRFIRSEKIFEGTVSTIYRTPMGQGITVTEQFYRENGLNISYTQLLSASAPEENFLLRSTHSKQSMITALSHGMEAMNMLIIIMLIGAVLLGSVVLYNLGIISFTERSRELATLKVLGFQYGSIRTLMLKQSIWLTLIGIVTGLFTGEFLINIMLGTMLESFDFMNMTKIWSYIIAAAGTFLLAIAVNLILLKKIKKVDMVSSLKESI